MRKLKEVIFSITNRCNLRCRMCGIPDQPGEELETGLWKRAIDSAARLKAQTIVFSGGEPLLRKDLFTLIRHARSRGLNTCVTSNGSLIDATAAAELARAGIGVVNISLEGTEGTHDFLRGEGTFKKALAALDRLHEAGVETTVATMVCRYNYSDLPTVAELAAEHNAGTVRFQPFSRIFLKPESAGDEFFFSQEPEAGIMEKTLEILRDRGLCTNPKGYLEQITRYLTGEKTFLKKGCSALWTSACINAEGKLFPCWVLTKEKDVIGSIARQEFDRIWNSRRHEQARRAISATGCPGCMLSCYDEIFGPDKSGLTFARKARKLFTPTGWNKLLRVIRRVFFPVWSRLVFFRSYQGGWKKIARRLRNRFSRARIIGSEKPSDRAGIVFEQIVKLRQEIERLK